ncbi:AAA family ATPase [Rhizobium sp. MC63]|nr:MULTISPECIES: AAA family ATPase [Rhizobium]MCJ9692690.1 AAA family ATPase [Rhizobium sp. PRIMUS64]SCB61303.1 AAA ATPase domain-containing protein [Rhizobium aethiopicum]ANK88256.1 hypothetical protein AMK02_PC00010 [Rhizobium sp. N731]ANL18502.1 hypothetical protein AMJ97_PC00010 [Rhizobium sp. N1314]ANL37092.1 hypothetical protein AMC89_PC00010 [Rhizobium phaseoli]
MNATKHDTPENAALVLRRRAAVVGTFDPVAFLQLPVRAEDKEAFEDRVLAFLSPMMEEVIEDKRVLWRLRPQPRRDTLREMAAEGVLEQTVRQTKPQVSDRFGQVLQAMLKKGAAAGDPRKMSTDDLMLQALALDFVRSLPTDWPVREPPVDPRVMLARKAERRRQDFVAPRKLFGRALEAHALDQYIESGLLQQPLVALPKPPSDFARLRPLLVTGIGGSGKSALVADLMRRTQKDDWSGPICVWIDFDQRNVALGGEREWLNEVTRQIGFARPAAAERLSAIRNAARNDLHRLTQESGDVERLSGTESLNVVSSMREEMQRALGDGMFAEQTLVVLVDTFEEVLVRSNMKAPFLDQEPFGLVLEFLNSLEVLRCHDGRPLFKDVRAVVAGRAHPFQGDDGDAARWFEARLEIGELGPEAAVEFLRSRADRQIFTQARSRRLVGAIPRFPIVLLLLAAFSRGRTAAEIEEAATLAEGSGVLGAASSTRVLYSRFLHRLKDHIVTDAAGERLISRDDLSKLAHPGLALTVVTPTLIREVLAGPTALGAIDVQKSIDLFEALSREVWLVERSGDDAIRHVPVLRRIMLPMLDSDLSPAGNSEIPMRETVRAVHRAAANWYRAGGGAGEPDAATLAAYHDAFLGEVGLLLTDPSLVRRLIDLAGEDVFAMPLAARAILRREDKSDIGLSNQETAALPVDARRKAVATRRAERARLGVTSRQAERYEPIGDLEMEQLALIDAGSDEHSYQGSGHGRQLDIVEDIDTARRIAALFSEADFEGVVRSGRSGVLRMAEAPEHEPPLDKLGDLTSHWLWKWALSCLATGAVQESDLLWATESASFPFQPSSRNPFALGTLLALAVATVALGRTPAFVDHAPYRDAITAYPVLASAPIASILSLRLHALSKYWNPALMAYPRNYFDVRADITQVVAIWGMLKPDEREGSTLLQIPGTLFRQIDEFQSGPPASTDLKILDAPEAFFRVSNEGVPAYRSAHGGMARAMETVLRGRTPELYDPIRAALGDVAADDPSGFGEALDVIAAGTPFWPSDCHPGQLFSTRHNLREIDFFLARLVVFLDLAGLTQDLFAALSASAQRGRRFVAVAGLLHRYDSLLRLPRFDEMVAAGGA